jgi:hypothetical protein
MGEVENTHGIPDQDVAKGNQCIHAANGQSGHNELDSELEFCQSFPSMILQTPDEFKLAFFPLPQNVLFETFSSLIKSECPTGRLNAF